MTRLQRARRLFLRGHHYAYIAKALNTSWSQARTMADPNGTWRTEPKPKECIGCGITKPPEGFHKNRNLPDHREARCKTCNVRYVGHKRARRKAEIVAETIPIPDVLFGCQFCKCPRQAHPDRPDYGKYFESQAEANTCCDHGETGTVPRVIPEPAEEHGYDRAMCCRILEPEQRRFGQWWPHYTKFLPTLHVGRTDENWFV